ncbi:MAG TPA: hypothetical protein VLA05_11485, partial [Coriobacteriia bacterium]|nr:hypothetical protein [Coriobacteriia bacterium]
MPPKDSRLEAEWRELEQVDYFLDQLARAVERGEVPRGSYDTLTPRYLKRREEIVAAITGENVSETTRHFEIEFPAAESQRGWERRPSELVQARKSVAMPRARRPLKRVEWTTVLLFLGAFLVIVASSIFAVAVWDVLSVEGKLLFLGGLTVCFYVAGWWAATRLRLKAGSAALLSVASAM